MKQPFLNSAPFTPATVQTAGALLWVSLTTITTTTTTTLDTTTP